MASWINDGTDLDRDGVICWQRIDVKRRMEAQFGFGMSEQSIGKLLRGLSFSRISVRPCHPKHDIDAQEAHKKLRRVSCRRNPPKRKRPGRRGLVARRSPRRPAGQPDIHVGASRLPAGSAAQY